MAKIKFPFVALGLILLLSLVSPTFPIGRVVASPDEVRWSRVNIPTEGRAGSWVLADGSDIHQLTMAGDGSLYCYANPTGTSYRLFKSTDGGYSWSYTGRVEDSIVALATAPDDASVVYYATSSNVYQSADGGGSFSLLPANPGGADSSNIEITFIAVASSGSGNIIAVGTRDTDDSQYGGIYTLDENESSTWTDSNLGNYDVYALAFSPDFATDEQLVAVVTNESNTIITTRIGGAGWGETIGDATIAGVTPVSAAIAFPSDYNSEVTSGRYIQFVAIDTGNENGDVYRINGNEAPTSSEVTDLNIGSAYGLGGVDITGLAVTGDATDANLLAGAAGSAQIYLSTDGGSNWTRSIKPPTGESKTFVLMASDFSSSGKAYAATSGTESALSISEDDGITWNQIGLIDTGISDIVDLAVSTNYSVDNTLFMLTFGGEHSLWRSRNGGTGWERIYSGVLADVDQIDLVELSPRYDSSQVVFLAGTSNGEPVIWKSTDNGQSFDQPKLVPFPIDIWVWAVVDDDTLFIGCLDAINNLGLVYGTTDSGSSYSTPAEVGSEQLQSIALSPTYNQDETILVGNTDGWVYWSNDNGASFEPLPLDATSSPLTDNISVAFDSQFISNNTVYAASDTADKGICRFIIGSSTGWESIDSTLPTGSMVSQLMLSADGALYAANSMADGGMERCLNPAYSPGPMFETVTPGLDDGATLPGLWLSGNQLWSIDTTNIRLMTYTDGLAVPVTLTSPRDRASGVGTITGSTVRDVSLEWESLSGATSYKWQLDYNTDFSSPSEDDTEANSARLEALESATTYYWRVRAIEPVLSPWSAEWSFTTALGTTAVALTLKSPGSGAKSVELKPVFQWGAITGAESYELLVSADVSFASPVIKKTGIRALPATAWQSDISLDYDTTYYWKVRAIGSDSYSAWSAVSAFTTELPSVELSPPGLVPARLTAPKLFSPEASANGVRLKPVFQWGAVAEAESYELLVSADVSFASPIIKKTGVHVLPTTTWQCDINLDYGATYYWKVRAVGSDSYSAWSAVSIFTTESPPELLSPSPLSPSSLPPSAQQIAPDWVLYLIGGLFVTIVLQLVIILVLVVGIRRL